MTPNEPTPSQPDQVASWLLADSPNGLSPEAAGRVLADNPGLRSPVADRLLIHGLLLSHYELRQSGAGELRRERVARVMSALSALPEAEPPVVGRVGPASRGWSVFRLRTLAVAAGVLLAVGVGMGLLGGPDGPTGLTGPRPAMATAAEVLARAHDTVSDDASDHEYRIATLNEDGGELRSDRLLLRGRLWAMQVGQRGVWVGSDGKTDWITTPSGLAMTPPERMIVERLRVRQVGYLRALLASDDDMTAMMGLSGLAGLIEHLQRDFTVVLGERGPAPGRAEGDCLHVYGERSTRPVTRVDIWADAATGVPQRIEIRLQPWFAGAKARRIVLDYQGQRRLGEQFYRESGRRDF